MGDILSKNEKLLNKLKSTAIVKQGTSEKSSGMYIGEANNPDCKENRNILITHKVYDFNDFFTVTSAEQYKRRTAMKNSDGTVKGYHEAGEYKQRKVLRKYPLESMKNISVCWAVAADYPSVSYGMTAWRRDVFVLDSDQCYNSLVEAKNKLDYFTTAFNMPKPNYILRNPKSKHIQAGWILEKPFTKRDFSLFNIYIKQIAIAYKDFTKCDGDICFNGPACKNPYYKDFEVTFPNEQVCQLNNFDSVYDYTPIANRLNKTINTINSSSSSLSYNNTDVTVDNTKNLIKSTSKSGAKHYFGDNTSRDYLECKWLRNWIWSCMRNEYTPTEKEARAKLQEFAVAAAKQTGKAIHSDSELNSKCKCTYNWAVSHFRGSTDKGKQRVGANFGNFIQKLQSYVAMYVIEQYKEKGLSTRKIAELTGYSIATISRSNLNKIDIDKINTFIKYYKSTEQDFQQQYKELYNILNNIVEYIYTINSSSSSLSYNNTDVTVESNQLQQDLSTMKSAAQEQSFAEKRLKQFLDTDYTWEEYRDFAAWKCLGVARADFSEFCTKYQYKNLEYFKKKYNIF